MEEIVETRWFSETRSAISNRPNTAAAAGLMAPIDVGVGATSPPSAALRLRLRKHLNVWKGATAGGTQNVSKFEVDGHVARIMLNRPEAMNSSELR